MIDKRNIILSMISLLLLLLFVILASIIREPAIKGLDILISKSFSFWRPVWLTYFFKTVTAFGSFAIGGFLAIIIAFVLWQRKKRIEALFITIAIAAVLLVGPLKALIARPRPSASIIGFIPINVGGLSFPSGHSVLSAGIYGFLLVIILMELKGALRIIVASSVIILVALIGLSRIYLGAHYLSDVIGGLLLGSTWCTLLTIFFLYTLDKKGNRPL